ncbi:MAG TPA: alpha/beta hydrolase [Gemmataceae bacterium]|nr:alpha/beta hydrolase [Gemmataceae bacterium]
MKIAVIRILPLVLALATTSGAVAADDAPFTRQQDVIYGRKFGVALTMDVFTLNKNANGIGIVNVISGGWFSAHDMVNALGLHREFLERGYTVFAVMHGSQPKFTIPEILEDMHRALRFIRSHARDYHIDPERIGITGASAGGHLSLMQGVGGKDGNAAARDPIEQVSSRVQAVACFFPPTDFLNYGEPGKDALGRGTLRGFKAPFDFSGLRRRDKVVCAHYGRKEARGYRPPHLAGLSRNQSSAAHAHHPRRRRQAGADPASRDHDRQTQGVRCGGGTGGQERRRPRLAGVA